MRAKRVHATVFIKFPVLIAIGMEPIPLVIMPFVDEAHGNAFPFEAQGA